jgi:DNA repair protein RadC
MNVKLKATVTRGVFGARDMYAIMQKILLRGNKTDRNREHLWTISLDNANNILNIELVSMGSINKTVVEPMEVFSVPLQKRAVSLVLVHNHPSNDIFPSEADKDITDRMIQCGLMLNVPVKDHLIITEKLYYSFSEGGLLAELQKSLKYVPDFMLKERMKKEKEQAAKEGEQKKAFAMAKAMLQKGEPITKIKEYTGLSRKVIAGLK